MTTYNATIEEQAQFTTPRYGCWSDWSFMTADSLLQAKHQAMGLPLPAICTPQQLRDCEAELASMFARVDFALSYLPDERLLHKWRMDISDALDDLPKLPFRKRVQQFIKLTGRFGCLCQSIVETKQRRDTAVPLDPAVFADFIDE
jgi:hypothetical protein